MDERTAKQFTISKASPVPLYFQLKAQLVELPKQGIFQAEDKLLTEAEFCELLDISRPTVRQAFSELINGGYVAQHKAEGTFVSRPKIKGYLFQRLGSFDEEMYSLHLTPSTKVIVSEVIELPEECVEIYPKSKQVFHLQRLRYADYKEMVLASTFVPCEHFLDTELKDLEQSSLYDIFLQKYQTEAAYADHAVEIRRVGQRGRTILNMEEGGVLVYVEIAAYIQQDEPAGYSITEYRGDRNRLKVRLTRRENQLPLRRRFLLFR